MIIFKRAWIGRLNRQTDRSSPDLYRAFLISGHSALHYCLTFTHSHTHWWRGQQGDSQPERRPAQGTPRGPAHSLYLLSHTPPETTHWIESLDLYSGRIRVSEWVHGWRYLAQSPCRASWAQSSLGRAAGIRLWPERGWPASCLCASGCSQHSQPPQWSGGRGEVVNRDSREVMVMFFFTTTMQQHNHYYQLHFILFWAFPPSANMFQLDTESSVLKWDQLIVFKPMLWVIEKKVFKILLQVACMHGLHMVFEKLYMS